jgi:hypothetical protein
MPALSINGNAVTGGVANIVNSNGVTFGLNGSSITASVAAGGAAISAAGSSQNAGTIVFSNSNGVSFGMNGSTVTGSVDAVRSVQAAGGQITGNAVSFADSNGVTFGTNGSTITVSTKDSVYLSQFGKAWDANVTLLHGVTPQTSGAVTGTTGSYSIRFWPFDLPKQLTIGSIFLPVSGTSTAATATGTATIQLHLGIYSQNGTNLAAISTQGFNYYAISNGLSMTTAVFQGTGLTASTTAGATTGSTNNSGSNLSFSSASLRMWTGSQIAGSLPAGQYWAGMALVYQTSSQDLQLAIRVFGAEGGQPASPGILGSMSLMGAGAAAGNLYGVLAGSVTSSTTAAGSFAALLPANVATSALSNNANVSAFPGFQLRFTS